MEYNETVNQIPEEEIGIPQEEKMPNGETHEEVGREGHDEVPAEGEAPSAVPEAPKEAGVEEEKEW